MDLGNVSLIGVLAMSAGIALETWLARWPERVTPRRKVLAKCLYIGGLVVIAGVMAIKIYFRAT